MRHVLATDLQPLYQLQSSAKSLLKPKLVCWRRWLTTLICIVARLITIRIRYLAHVLQRSLSTIIKIVVEGSIDQIYTGGWSNGCYLLRPLVITTSSSFMQVPTRSLDACFWQGVRLTISRFCLRFFFRRLKNSFFLIRRLALPTTNIYFPNACKELKCSLRLGLNSLIEHFVSQV